jgi:membrane-associated phospholipid phosphatase
VSTTAVLPGRLAARPHAAVAALALATAGFTVAMAVAMDLPLRDPDGIAGPAYVRLPLILALMFALDVVPRALRRARGPRDFAAATRAVVGERWSWRRAGLVFVGLMSFYLTYVAYRNLKSFLPFVRDGRADAALLDLDAAMAFGSDPAQVLHALLGTGISAHVLSIGYVFFLVFVPLSLGAALVWTRDLRRGYFWVTALCINWVLGALSYYVLPSLGPVYVRPELFADLPFTEVTRLQTQLLTHRVEVLASPHGTQNLHGIAAFASLHVAIVFSAALVAHLIRTRRLLRWSLWAFLVMTILATIYFGWHYLIDDVAGLGIGAVAVWLAALATGHELRRGAPVRRRLAAEVR